MNTILSLDNSDWNYPVDIEFNVKDGKLISSKTDGDETPLLLEIIFLYFKKEISIPLCYLEGDVIISLSDGDSESDEMCLDVYFYRGDDIDEDFTPIFHIDEGLMSDIKTTFTLSVIENHINNHINSIEYRNSLMDCFKNVGLEIEFDEKLPIFNVNNDIVNNINSHISWK